MLVCVPIGTKVWVAALPVISIVEEGLMGHYENVDENQQQVSGQNDKSQNLFEEGAMEVLETLENEKTGTSCADQVVVECSEPIAVGESVEQVVNAAECSEPIAVDESVEQVVDAAECSEPVVEEAKKSRAKQPKAFAPLNKELEELLALVESESDPDKKITIAVDKMESYLSQSGTPQFKNFWELRKLCLELFKLNISPSVRAVLWPKYSDLSKEARRLKEIFDEQSAFAVEQIDIAITAMENEVRNYDAAFAAQPESDFQLQSQSLEGKADFYKLVQKKLNLLNAHAARVNNLRRELIRMDMRIKHKNKFFQRLSAAGDNIFPLRKELIKEVSDQFVGDVDLFVKTHFQGEAVEGLIFFLREEIKNLQGIAKVLTLNTHSFTTTRKNLSECWDKLKLMDKERKKERGEKRDLFQKNKSEIQPKITEIKDKFAAGEISVGNALDLLDAVQQEMRNIDLGRDEVKELREELAVARSAIGDKKKADEEERVRREEEKFQKRKEQVENLQARIQELNLVVDELKADDLEQVIEANKVEVEEIIGLSQREKNELLKSLRHFRDVISTKRENEILSLSESDQETFKKLKDILKQRKSRRKEIKEQVDRLRKVSGLSGFDFEKAMQQTEQLAVEKELLDKADLGIAEIEHKLVMLKRKK